MTPLLWMLGMTFDDAAVAAALARARALTRAEIACKAAEDPDEIVVCAARRADRYRLPLVPVRAEGDPATVDAIGERERLLAVPALPCGIGATLQGCGKVGATFSTRTGLRGGSPRPLAK